MNVEELQSAFISALDEDSTEWKSYLLSMLAAGLTNRSRAVLSQWSSAPQMVAKLSILNKLQGATSLRVVKLLSNEDASTDEAFTDALFELARQGECEAELTVTVRNVLTVLALQQLPFSEEHESRQPPPDGRVE